MTPDESTQDEDQAALERRDAWEKHLSWRATITQARYGGCYEGGKWLSFPFDIEGMETFCSGWNGDDLTCSSFWDYNAHLPIGKGRTPDEAFADMEARLATYRSHKK